MILPADISNMMLHHLSLSHDEHMGAIRTHANGLMNNITGQSASRINNAQVAQVSANSLNNIQNGGSPGSNSVTQLNSLPVTNSTLQAEAAKASRAKKYATVDPVTKRDRDEGRNNHSQQQTQDARDDNQLSEFLELQALKTVTETLCTVQESTSFQTIFVSLIYRQTLENTGVQMRGQLLTVSPLDEQSGQIPAHTTLLMQGQDGVARSRHMPSQIVYGQPVIASDWLNTHMERISALSQMAWRIQATGFSTGFNGVAMIVGEIPVFNYVEANISIHIPGISNMWHSRELNNAQ